MCWVERLDIFSWGRSKGEDPQRADGDDHNDEDITLQVSSILLENNLDKNGLELP